MKVYYKNETPEFRHPQDMRKILDYLDDHGTLKIHSSTVESLYREFSDEKYSAGWIRPDVEILERFADWLAEVDL